MQPWVKTAAIFAALAVIGWVVWTYTHPGPETNPIRVENDTSAIVLPFSTLTTLEELPLGWVHDLLYMTQPAQIQFVEKDGRPTARCETIKGGSILRRTTDIEIGDYQILEWDWLIDSPISSPLDEATPEGDDHPVRLLLELEDKQGGEHTFEIIWSNSRFEPGDIVRIGETAQYVANGLDENTKVWLHQEVNLMDVYREITGMGDYPLLTSIAILCDSDNTGTRSIAYISDVELHKR